MIEFREGERVVLKAYKGKIAGKVIDRNPLKNTYSVRFENGFELRSITAEELEKVEP